MPTALPSLDATVAPPEEAVAEFAAKGHTVVRGLASGDEVGAFRPAIEAAATARAWNKDIPPEDRDTYTKAFLQAINLWRVDETIRRFVLAPRFGRVAAELLGVDGVRLYHDQALFKEPHGGHTPWHQDQCYWPLEGPCTVTMWMPLVDVPPEVGSMTFASGSHLRGDLRGPAISDASEDAFARAVEDLGLACETHGALAAGDATFHAGWTLHRAGPNPTDRMRPVMTVIYVAEGARVVAPQRPEQKLDHRMYLPGTEPGDLAATELNPLVWHRED